jgi:translation initiation factor 1
MKLKVTLETGGRRGKQVTVIRGLTHNPQVIDALTKKIKSQLGTGGTIKGKVIEIQGNHLKKVQLILEKEGYTVS